VAEYYPVTRVTEADDGGLVVELEIADPRWLQRLMLRLAPDAVLLEPRGLAESVRATARKTLNLYG
jgi:proteasome accessory factor C